MPSNQCSAWLHLAAACCTRYRALIEEDFELVEAKKNHKKITKKIKKKYQGNAWLYLAAACRTRYLALIEEDFVLVEALPRSSALLRSAAALLAHHSLGAFLRRLCSGAMKAL